MNAKSLTRTLAVLNANFTTCGQVYTSALKRRQSALGHLMLMRGAREAASIVAQQAEENYDRLHKRSLEACENARRMTECATPYSRCGNFVPAYRDLGQDCRGRYLVPAPAHIICNTLSPNAVAEVNAARLASNVAADAAAAADKLRKETRVASVRAGDDLIAADNAACDARALLVTAERDFAAADAAIDEVIDICGPI